MRRRAPTEAGGEDEQPDQWPYQRRGSVRAGAGSADASRQTMPFRQVMYSANENPLRVGVRLWNSWRGAPGPLGGAVRRMKAVSTLSAPALRVRARPDPRKHPTLMQDHQVVAWRSRRTNGWPRARRCPVRHEPSNVAHNVGAGLDVEPDGRFVEQQEARPVQQRAGDLIRRIWPPERSRTLLPARSAGRSG